MRRCHTSHVAATVLACWLSSIEPAAAGQTWSVVESGATRVITDDAPAVAESLADEVLLTRSMLKQLASIEPHSPLHVFALKDRNSLTDFAPQRLKRSNVHAFGFSHSGPYSAFIALRTDRPEALRSETLRHEYAHVLTAGLSPDAPAWLDEGLAEFWSSIVVEGDRLIAGRPVARHLELLRKRKWLSLDAVVNQRRGSLPSKPEHIQLFYAQAWAMVHYLMLGPDANGLANFMPSTSPLPEQFHSTIQRYVEAGRFNESAVAWHPPAASPARATSLSGARALAERADLLLSGEQPQTALAVARQALAIEPNEPLALEVTGTYHFLNNQPQQARDWLEKAVATGVTSHRAALYLSLLSTEPAERERYLTLAVARKPDSDVAWQRLAAIFESDGRLEIARRWCAALSVSPLPRFFLGPSAPFCFLGRQ